MRPPLKQPAILLVVLTAIAATCPRRLSKPIWLPGCHL